jgi:putative ABC transport system permease protein
MAHVIQDLRYALRQLRKNPGFAAVAVITLALGIGANTAVFSVVDAVMLRPLPYYQPEQLVEAVSVRLNNPVGTAVCYPDFFDWRNQNHTLEHLVSYHDSGFTLTGLDRPVQLEGEVVSGILPALGVQPELGRGFTPDEEKTGTRVILISHALWNSQFGGDKSIVGRAVRLSGELYTVIGVMPRSFRFPLTRPSNSLWTTLAVDDDPGDPHSNLKERGAHFLNVFGRLRPGTSVARADQDLKAIAVNPRSNIRTPTPNTPGEGDHGDRRIARQYANGTLVVLGSVFWYC